MGIRQNIIGHGNGHMLLCSGKFSRVSACLLLLVAALVVSTCLCGCLTRYTGDETLEVATVERVVDGDTLKVSIDGESYRVRLIGMDAPESVAPDDTRNTEEGGIASNFTKSLVSEGQTVYLQKDTSDTDTYGRLLRYVWLEYPGTDLRNIYNVREYMLNGVLVYEGYAEAKSYKPDTAYDDIFTRLQNDAVANGRGVSYMWSETEEQQTS